MKARIKFFGGPYDGHTQTVLDVNLLEERIALPVNRNIFRILKGLNCIENATTTSVAIYDFNGNDYVFSHAVKP